jgi:iron(III) transport system substrate-binding protein
MGNGGPVVIKNSPHPNATKVFVNWLLSKEGQELYSKAQGQATRRLDVDTKSMEEFGIRAAKDYISIEEYYKRENQSETKVKSVRRPAQEFAKKVLP